MTGQPKTALAQIPTDEQGKKAFEKAESPKAAYDALLEMSKGDSEIAASAVSFKLAEKEKAVKDLEKAKITPASNSMEDIIAAQQERKALIAQAQSEVEFWKGVLAAKDAPVVEEAVEQPQANETQEDVTKEVVLSEEEDNNGANFVIAPNGTTTFGTIGQDTGLTSAPIKLSEGIITNPETNAGYGLVHIEARHGEEIRNAGYKSVLDFISDVATRYDRIVEGVNREHGGETYLVQLIDEHNNTLYIELSKDGSYWNINSAGIFNKKYASGRKEVYNRHTQVNQSAEISEGSPTVEQSGTQTEASTMPPTHSLNKDSEAVDSSKEKSVKKTEGDAEPDFENDAEYQKLAAKLDEVEQSWQERIQNYIAEHYPTQATVSAQTKSPEGMKEREAMKADKVLKDMIAQSEAEIDAVDKQISEYMAAVEQPAANANEETAEEAVEEPKPESRAARKQENVPDWLVDSPKDARERGYRRVSGERVERQTPLEAVQGKEVKVKFGNKKVVPARVVLIEAEELQPSHVQGYPNSTFFIDEAQPKGRTDEVSVYATRQIGERINPEEITSSTTAYTGAPTVNPRGEVIQGNSRSDALKYMYQEVPASAEKYKQYLIDNAAEFGLNSEEVAAMEHPVLVNMADVTDEEAIELGQYTAADTESGGVERIKAKNTIQKLGDRFGRFAEKLLTSEDDSMSFSELLDKNGVEVLKWLRQIGAITDTQYQSAFTPKGNLSGEAKNDLKNILFEAVFKDAATQMENMFAMVPAKAQRAILATAYRDYNNPDESKLIPHIQHAIGAYYELLKFPAFVNAKTEEDIRRAVDVWSRQYAFDEISGESYIPLDIFDNFAIELATRFKVNTQKTLQEIFNSMYDKIQGKASGNMFEAAEQKPLTLREAVKQVLNIDYGTERDRRVNSDASNNSENGKRGERGDAGKSENSEQTPGRKRASTNRRSTGSVQKENEVKSSSEKRTEKIEDFGEKIAGARKDMIRTIADYLGNVNTEALIKMPFSKVFKSPNLKQLVSTGAITEEDAVFLQSLLFGYLSQPKPRVTKGEEWRARRYGQRTRLEDWAEKALSGITFIRDYLLSSPSERKEMKDKLTSNEYPLKATEEATRTSPGVRFPYGTGHLYTPNPINVLTEVLHRLKYKAGDKTNLPAVSVSASMDGRRYDLNDKDGKRIYVSEGIRSLEDAINKIVQLAKMQRGDTDVEYGKEEYSTVGVRPITKPSGRFYVSYLRKNTFDVKQKNFDSREEAEKYAESIQSKGGDVQIGEYQERTGYEAYQLTITNPITRDRVVLDKEYPTAADALAALDEDHDAINEETNEKISGKLKRKAKSVEDIFFVGNEFTMSESKGRRKYAVYLSGESNPTGQTQRVSEFFDTLKEAKDWFKENTSELQRMYDELKAKLKNFVYFGDGEKSRIGADYRQGQDVTPEQFSNMFGFRGVQFGNWTNDRDRQNALNNAYDAFLDLADILGVSPRAMSLNGELGVAFGSRGSGSANAHYEPGEVVINLTKTRGTGSLAHEWWHALDNYFARQGGNPLGMLTHSKDIAAKRDEIRKAYNNVIDTVNRSNYAGRSKVNGPYWADMIEMTARLFGEWVVYELAKTGRINHFLSRGIDSGVWDGIKKMRYDFYVKTKHDGEAMSFEEFKKTPDSIAGVPYPTEEESEELGKAVRELFDTVQEKVDAETGKTMLYREGNGPVSDDAISYENDPVSKALGYLRYSPKRRNEFADRERERMVSRINRLCEKLNLDNVEVVTSDSLDGRKAKAKGFFNPNTGKITIVLDNHVSSADAEQTLFHEAVAHYGLRKMFGEHFDTFLDNVYNNASDEVKSEINKSAQENNQDIRTATEEHLASLAEDINYEKPYLHEWWGKIKHFFIEMLGKIGVKLPMLTDNELRYVLYVSGRRLESRDAGVFGAAEDIAVQNRLKVGNYAEQTSAKDRAAEDEDLLFREEEVPDTGKQSEKTTIATAISSTSGTKVLKNLDNAIEQYLKISGAHNSRTFLGNLAESLGIHKNDKSSRYKTFETLNGKILSIRLSNHNATVSNFDNNKEGDGLSIVIARTSNKGIANDGNAHIVEFFYKDKDLNKAEGQPLVEILKSVKQALYSGEYKDRTGLAQREEVNSRDLLNNDTRFRTSDELDEEFPEWLSGQTTATGQHSTQVKNTVKTYNKIGDWLENSGVDKNAIQILDASSGLGLGTKELRERGFSVDDVEPYPSENRPAPTYSSYDDIDKKYDVVISNAVLNVIPDNWRKDVLLNMAGKVKDGGEIIINVRDAKEIAAQKQKIELDEPSEILVTDKKGNIRAYQKGFSQEELEQWVSDTLGNGWTISKATKQNSGFSGRTIVAVNGETPRFQAATPNNEMTTNPTTIREEVQQLADELHTPVRFVEDVNDITDSNAKVQAMKRRARGWYDVNTGEVVIVLPNADNAADARETVFHEVVAHKGLRELLGKDFDIFLYNVYANASLDIRRIIADNMVKNGWGVSEATEEYMAKLAEDGPTTIPESIFLYKVKDALLELLRAVGINLGFRLSNNELRYVLWKSYQNLHNKGIIGAAEDVVMQNKLEEGNYSAPRFSLKEV